MGGGRRPVSSARGTIFLKALRNPDRSFLISCLPIAANDVRCPARAGGRDGFSGKLICSRADSKVADFEIPRIYPNTLSEIPE